MSRSIRYSILFSQLCAAGVVHAQSSASIVQPPAPPQRIEEVVVVGNPLDARDVVPPVATLSGTDLLIKRASTLGETLNGLPGVASTWFGPNSSRPVIRGLDGDRVRILNNLGSSLDASSLSADHNPSIDPLVIERIEVLRGPAALLYGGTAIGGVVNIVDNRIPRRAISGVSGSVETRFGGAERERGTSAVLEAGAGTSAGAFAIHADGFTRDTRDYRVPSSTGIGEENGGRVVNSSADSRGGAIGASWQLPKGYIGAVHSLYESNYGTVAEEKVRIDMQQKRDAIEANFRDLGGVITGVFAKFSQSDYKHTEFDDGEAATRFKNKGNDFRAEIKHAAIGNMQGVIGLQTEQFDFSALGDEAFVPQTRTRNAAAFVYEEISLDPWKLSFGGRVETSRVSSDGAANGGAARFGDARTRKFTMGNAAFGATYKLNDAFSLGGSFAYAERPPSYYELFADGPHAATGAYEVGDPSFKRERSTALDLSLRWKQGTSNARVGVFAQQFRNYMALRRSGIDRDAEGNGQGVGVGDCGDGTSVDSACTSQIFPEFRYSAVSARLRGFEADGKFRVVDRPYTVDVEGKIDYVRADDRFNNEPLPRIAPLRMTAGAIFGFGQWGARLELQNAAKQNRFARDDAIGATDGYTLINAAVTYTFGGEKTNGTVFIRGTNLSDRKAYSASSIDTIRALAPLPGRGVKAGVQFNF
jgi:iron complex outermembrane recepter protein